MGPRIVAFPSSMKRLSRTPDSVIRLLHREFAFDSIVDARETGLSDAWRGDRVWVHVDYSAVEAWLRKILRERDAGKTLVVLMPARTSTTYFHDFVLGEADELRFLRGRLVLDGNKKQSPYASVIAVYEGRRRDSEGAVLSLTGDS